MRVLVIDQCSGSKDYPEDSPVFMAADIDAVSREELLGRDRVARQSARQLYSGRQQQYVTEAVDTLRSGGHDVDRYFISAGFGVVAESTDLPPYEVTFTDMSAAEITERAAALNLTADVQALLSADPPYDVVFFALGSDYYGALDLETILETLPSASTGVLFNQAELVDGTSSAVSIPARTDDAEAHDTITVALKGVYLKNFAAHVTEGATVTTPEDVVDYCTTEYPPQSGLDSFG